MLIFPSFVWRDATHFLPHLCLRQGAGSSWKSVETDWLVSPKGFHVLSNGL
jgi:hypothetical protein